jgi:hypothetical protein
MIALSPLSRQFRFSMWELTLTKAKICAHVPVMVSDPLRSRE